jgi:hypothetical protein
LDIFENVLLLLEKTSRMSKFPAGGVNSQQEE